MTLEEFREALIRARENQDTEVSHCDADNLLVTMLRQLGYDQEMDIYESIEKWYA